MNSGKYPHQSLSQCGKIFFRVSYNSHTLEKGFKLNIIIENYSAKVPAEVRGGDRSRDTCTSQRTPS